MTMDKTRAVRPLAPEPEGGWTYERRFAAHLHDDDDDRTTVVTVPDQIGANQRAYDGLAFPTDDGRRVWLDGEAYDLHGSGTGDMIVRDAADPNGPYLDDLTREGWRILGVEDRRVHCTGYAARTPDGDLVVVYVDGDGIVIHVSR